MCAAGPSQLCFPPGTIIVVLGDVEAEGCPVGGVIQGGLLYFELDLIPASSPGGGSKPIIGRTECRIARLVIAPGAVRRENVLPLKRRLSAALTVEVDIEEDLDAIIFPSGLVLAASSSSVGKNLVVEHVNRDINRVDIMNDPGRIAIVAQRELVIPRANVEYAGVRIDLDLGRPGIFSRRNDPIDRWGGGNLRGLVGPSAKQKVAPTGLDVRKARPMDLAFDPGTVVVVVNRDVKTNDVSRLGIADSRQRDAELCVISGAVS